MSSHARVLNVTNGCRIKRSQALGRIEHCISTWVEEGFTIRDLSLAERVQARTKQTNDREPLALAEIPGLIFQPSLSGQASARRGYALIREAHAFVAS